MSKESRQVCNVGIIGGGKGGLELLKIFTGINSANVCFICDIDANAPALQYAREIGINTETDLVKSLEKYNSSFIIEATGSGKVLQIIKEHLKENAKLIDSSVALLFYELMADTRRTVNEQVTEELSAIKTEIDKSLQNVGKSLTGIKRVAIDLDMLALNARVEAAHAKNYGKGFSVVADEVKNSSKAVSTMAQDISEINDNIDSISKEISVAVKKLA